MNPFLRRTWHDKLGELGLSGNAQRIGASLGLGATAAGVGGLWNTFVPSNPVDPIALGTGFALSFHPDPGGTWGPRRIAGTAILGLEGIRELNNILTPGQDYSPMPILGMGLAAAPFLGGLGKRGDTPVPHPISTPPPSAPARSIAIPSYQHLGENIVSPESILGTTHTIINPWNLPIHKGYLAYAPEGGTVQNSKIAVIYPSPLHADSYLVKSGQLPEGSLFPNVHGLTEEQAQYWLSPETESYSHLAGLLPQYDPDIHAEALRQIRSAAKTHYGPRVAGESIDPPLNLR